jgi:cytochrome c556
MKPLLIIATGAALVATSVAAQDFTGPIKARQGQFWTMALNLSVLGDMAKGERDYDAAAAQAAADSLAGVAMLDQSRFWVEGSDNFELATTRAKPSIWENPDDFAAKWGAFQDGAATMQAAAGQGLDEMRGAMGAVGGTCKACHEAHRGPEL